MGRFRGVISVLALLCAAAPSLAFSQTTVDLPGNRVVPDANGVDILSGTIATVSPFKFEAPAASHLNFQTVFNGYKLSFPLNIYLDDNTYSDTPDPSYITFSLSAGGEPKVFNCDRASTSGRCSVSGGVQTDADGSYLEVIGLLKFRYVDRDGAQYTFDRAMTSVGTGCHDDISPCHYTTYYYSVSQIIYPNGEKLTFQPFSEKIVENGSTYFRDTVISNLGYSIKFYENRGADSNAPSTTPGANWNHIARNGNAANGRIELYRGLTKISTISSSVTNTNGADGSLSSTFVQQTDDLGRQFKILSTIAPVVWCSGDLNGTCTIPIDKTQLTPISVTSPGGLTKTITYSTYPVNGVKHVQTLTDGVNTWNYQYSRFSHVITDPLNNVNTYTITPGSSPYYDPFGNAPDYVNYYRRLASYKDPLNNEYAYIFLDSIKQHYISSYPELNKFVYEATGRAENVDRVRSFSKTGSELNSDGIWQASYPATCASNVSCNKPDWVQDAKGSRTTYTYYDTTHGGLHVELFPADDAGKRRQNTYTYEAKDTGDGVIYRLQQVESCLVDSAQNCTGVKTRTSYTYWASTFLPETVTQSTDDVVGGVTTTYVYDDAGRVIQITDAKGNKTFRRYDVVGRLIGEILPSVSKGQRLARRIGYDADDHIVTEDSGTVPDGQTGDSVLWDSFGLLTRVTNTYDPQTGYKTRTTISTGVGEIKNLTQFSYDADGRLLCTAVRMDPAQWNSQSDACVAQTNGQDGADRITRNIYYQTGRLHIVQKGYGTTKQQNYATYTYTPNGKRGTVADSNNNLTGYKYDGFDRLQYWNFPDKGTAGTTSTTDYEAYTYDTNGNRVTLRKRDGSTVSYLYDALNRVTKKDIPNSTTADVYYGYDIGSRQLYARFGSASGKGLTNSYDGFGRLTSSSNDLSGSALTLRYQYDADGNRTRLTYPDSTYFTFDYDNLDRQTAAHENGGTIVATISYDAQGRRSGDTRSGVTSTYVYDAMSRPFSLSDDLAGTASDVTTTFGYNPANQIISKTRNNNTYGFTAYFNANRNYAVNGLNQYTSAGPASFSYDANGNLTGDGTNSYTYDVENRLISRNGSLSLSYDPNGRLWQTSGGASGTTRYLYDGDELVAEYDGSGSMLRRYVHGPADDDPVLWYEGAGLGDRRSLQIDQQGSIVSIADTGGNKLAIDSYDEYGIPSSTNIGRFQYTGQAWLPDLGMYYYKARMYSPTLGRFMQADPIGYADQNNLYTYVGNDPINAKDPSGECSESDHWTDCSITITSTPFPSIIPPVFIPGTPENRRWADDTIKLGRRLGDNFNRNATSVCFWFWVQCNKPPSDAKDPNGAKAPGKPGDDEGFKDPPNGEDWGKIEEGPLAGKSGWVDADDMIWVPTGQGGRAHGAGGGLNGAHWDVQDRRGRGHRNVYPGGRVR